MSARFSTLTLNFLFVFLCFSLYSQCPTCGNGVVDAGETHLTCPQDISHGATCTSPCAQPSPYEAAAGIRIAHDFVGTTTYGAAGLPAGWSFAGAPTPTTSGALPAPDGYGAKGGLVQPNCSGLCTSTNGFCIGNIASSSAVGAGGTGGKLGANFDGRANVTQNSSYAVLRGQGNPTLVSETFNMSAVEGFKIQFWLNASESSCGQGNGWGSCTGNTAFLDFSSNGGTTWVQIMQMNTSSSNSDMCTNATANTFWISEGTWSRVCLTVFKSSTSPGNFYPAATANTAPSGIMVNSTYFTANFKFRIRYAQTASCTSGITATNPGRYLAIDYPVVTSGGQMIPCGISFSNMCGYGADNNDDGVGSSTLTTLSTAFGTIKRGVNHAERGVEIFNSQTASFGNQNLTGSNFTTNFDLCNPEGGDNQCIDWRLNNNSYAVVYECVTDWEPSSNGVFVSYYKNGTAQSVGMTKVTTAGKTPTIGWRMTASRYVNCSGSMDLNPGCNGYYFQSASLPTQFIRAFYALKINSTGQAYSYYGPSSCSNYFNGPTFAPIMVPDTLSGSGNYVTCSNGELRFLGTIDYCSTTGFVGSNAPNFSVTGPGGFAEVFPNGDTSLTAITTAGDYILTPQFPASAGQCMDCARSTCITVTAADISGCVTPLAVELIDLQAVRDENEVIVTWKTSAEKNNAYFTVSHSTDGLTFSPVAQVPGCGSCAGERVYETKHTSPQEGVNYYRLNQTDVDGQSKSVKTVSIEFLNEKLRIIPNPSTGLFQLEIDQPNSVITIENSAGLLIYSSMQQEQGTLTIDLSKQPKGVYLISVKNEESIQLGRLVLGL